MMYDLNYVLCEVAIVSQLSLSHSCSLHGKDMWAALEATFGPSGAGNELYVMEQFCDYKMTDERSVVQQTHEIQSLAKELEYFKCVLWDKTYTNPQWSHQEHSEERL